MFFIINTSAIKAQTLLEDAEENLVLEKITNNWKDWNIVNLSGKFKMSGLPVSPTIKVSMEKGKAIYMSLRVPILGEVGRIEIDSQSITAVNKMKRVYVKENIGQYLQYYPGSVSDIQELLLGKIVMPGFGVITPGMGDSLDVYGVEGGKYAISPNGSIAIEGVEYGYMVGSNLKPEMLLVVPENNPELNIMVEYSYPSKGYDMKLSLVSPTRNMSATIEFNEPEWNGNLMNPLKLTNKYTKVTIQQFMNSF